MEFLINDNDSELATAPAEIRSGRYTDVKLNIENCHFIRPVKLVRWRCLIDLSVRLGLKVQILPPAKEDVKSYAGRMGLFRDTNYTYPHRENEATTFFPLIRITNDRNESLYEECQRVFGYSSATANYVNRVSDAFVELADNIYFHSGQTANSGWGYIHAQAHKQSGNIRLGICDVGVGIYGSYERTNQLRDRSEEALTKDIFEELESSSISILVC